MLLTITYTGKNTEELSYLLYKNPHRPQMFELNHGKAYVFYPELSDGRTTAALLLDIDPIDLARGKAGSQSGGLFDYVNDRPYVSSSFMSTAISKVFGTAISGRADSRQALSDSPIDLTATVTMLPCRGEREKLKHIFEPLGYSVNYEIFDTDENFPEWGQSKHVNLTISGKTRLRDLLKHLYVLIPVFDRQKHYWVGRDEVEKLMRMGEDWLQNHPEKKYIIGRYLNRQTSLVNMAFERLYGESGEIIEAEVHGKKPRLNDRRMESVVAELKKCGARRVIDIGCGEGRLLKLLLKDGQFTQLAGTDVSHVALKRASERLKLESAGESLSERVHLFQGSLTYKDSRLSGFDAACVVEVVEHLDLSRLAAFERVLFEFAKPPVVIITTPNKEFNANYANLGENDLRHGDHRFEWTRAEFKEWAEKTSVKFGYSVKHTEVGACCPGNQPENNSPEKHDEHGAPTQMAVFTLRDSEEI